MSVINTNITSMIGQSNLSKSQSALQTSMERLSSGLRINSAKDDAAGQAIANRMTAQITGLAQAQRNANDGISIAQTAEGSLNQVNDNLQRIRELSVQAQNGTNSQDDLTSIQEEIDQRLAEIDRISEQTAFNGVDVLAKGQELVIQVGANDGQTITVNLKEINSRTLGLDGFSVERDADIELSDALGAPVAAQPAVNLDITDLTGVTNLDTGASASRIVTDADGAYFVEIDDGASNMSYIAIDLQNDTNASGVVTLNAGGALGTDTPNGALTAATAVEITPAQDAVPGLGTETNVPAGSTIHRVLNEDGEPTDTYVIKSGDALYAATGVDDGAGNINITGKTVSYTDDSGAQTDVNVQYGGADGKTEFVTIGDQRYDASFVDGKDFSTLTGDPSLLEGEALGHPTASPLAALDAALKDVDTLRSELGAVQNRFEDAITNLNTNETNLAAARSRIEDADYAVEVANMTRAQILQQAGTSVLAQANQIPQNVLSLLG